MAALSSIAERYDRVILHNVRGARHSYVVRDEVSWYRYQIRPDGGLHARQAAFDATPAYALAQAS
jgi:hypothetical protein